MNYAYGRVSARDQRLERQLDAFSACGIPFDKIYCDFKSGKDFNRTQYSKLIKRLRSGDLLVIKSIDRLGRDYDAIIEQWKKINKEIGANVLVLDMPLLDTRTADGNLIGKFISDLVLQLLSFVAQNEREHIKTRQAEGIKSALKRGVKFGRPLTACPKDFEQIITAYRNKELTCKQAIKKSQMRPSTFYHYLKKHPKPIEALG